MKLETGRGAIPAFCFFYPLKKDFLIPHVYKSKQPTLQGEMLSENKIGFNNKNRQEI